MVRKLMKRVSAKLLTALAAVGGLLGAISCPAYGAPVPDYQYDPQLMLTNLNYTPEEVLSGGERVYFEVGANKSGADGYVSVRIGDPLRTEIRLHDDGFDPDTASSDGVWSGFWQVPQAPETGTLPVTALFNWYLSAEPLELDGDPLVIEEAI